MASNNDRYPDTPACKRCIHKHCEKLLQLPRTPGKIMFVHRSKFDFKCDFEPPPEWKTEKKNEPEVLTDDLVVITGKVEVTNPRWEHKDPEKKKNSPDKASVGDIILFMVDIKNFPDGAFMAFDIFDTSQKPAQTISTAKGKNEKGIGKAEWKIEDKQRRGEKLNLAFEGIARSKASDRVQISLVENNSAIIELLIHPQHQNAEDVFILKSSDGTYKKELKVADDKIKNDEKLTLEYTGLTKGKQYTLQYIHFDSNEGMVYFENVSFEDLMKR
jgi:hypothetical protein